MNHVRSAAFIPIVIVALFRCPIRQGVQQPLDEDILKAADVPFTLDQLPDKFKILFELSVAKLFPLFSYRVLLGLRVLEEGPMALR